MAIRALEFEIELVDLLFPLQLEIATHPARFRCLVAGRRFGKTRLGAALTVASATQGGSAWWIAPSFPMAQIGWRLIKSLSFQVPHIHVNESERIVTFASGGSIQVKSADNPDSLRGAGLDLAVFDEAAYIREEAWTEAIRPALSDRKGRAMFISTPCLRNWFFGVYRRGFDEDPDWKSWREPTAANPYIDPAEIEAAREQLPENIFRQEYEAAFLENAGVVFRNIEANLVPDDQQPEMHRRHRIVMGVDWAQITDWTALSVVCVDCRRELALDRFNKIDFNFQRDRLEALYRKWNVAVAMCELNSIGTPNVQAIANDGFEVAGFQTTALSKPPLIQSLALALERAQYKWIANAVATGELESYEVEANATTGRPSYSAPPGCHDDTVIARALALKAALVEPLRLI